MSLPKPYYEDSRAGIVIYHGDCREIIPQLEGDIGLVLADPPYGINHPTDYASRRRGGLTDCRTDYAPVYDDDKPFDPSHLLALDVPTILWGGNYFADKLPTSSGWLVWDKERPDDLDQATVELAWTNYVKGARRFRFMWNGMLRAGDEPLYHPTQKPVALMGWCLGLKWTPPGTVLDPYMGAGPTLVAAKESGRSAIGIEIREEYCAMAVRRLAQEVLF